MSKLWKIPADWEVTPLGDLGEFSKGKGISKNETSTIGVPCIRYAEIYTDYNYVVKRFKSFVSEDKIPTTKKLKKNDILFAGSGETADDIGKSICFVHEYDAYVGGDTIIFSPIHRIDSTFLVYQLNDDIRRTQLRKFGQGSSIVHIYSSSLRHLKVNLPPLPEQRKIASILTSVDEVIENTQKQIEKLRDLKKAVMNELLTRGIGHTEFKDSELGRIPKGWEIVATANLFNFKNGLNKEKSAFGRGQKIVNYMDVFTCPEIKDYDLHGRVELSKSETDRFLVREGDVFFTRTSETPEEVGLSSVITKVSEKVCFSGFVLRGRPVKSKLFLPLSGYLYRSNYVRQQIVRTCSYTTRALTNGTSLGKVLIAVPSHSEQKFIYALITSISENISQWDRKLSKFKSLKKSLMQDLLTGKVRVKVN